MLPLRPAVRPPPGLNAVFLGNQPIPPLYTPGNNARRGVGAAPASAPDFNANLRTEP